MEHLGKLARKAGDRICGRLPLYNKAQRVREIIRNKVNLDKQRLHAQLEQFERELLKEDRYSDQLKLNHYEHQVFSQFGEDGIIAEIFRRIGTTSKTFLEIGVGNGLENNTTFLLFQGWSGYWIDGDEEQAAAIRSTFSNPIRQGRLSITNSFVTKENIAKTLEDLNVPIEMDLFSLDIDRNTYEIWEALSDIKPRVIVLEYNATIPPDVEWKVEYHADRYWNLTHYFGASLKTFEKLGERLGYCLVGCNLAGLNAFFVRKDLCDGKFAEPFTSENHYERARYFLFRKDGHPACYDDDEH